ncbi:MAG: HEPN domain-containing protein [Bacillota bacterium]|nr:HEPN domain-containing protein [Bacillota bacterium]
MTPLTLAQSYLIKARARLKILGVLLDEEAYSDVVREAQEVVELALKAILRQLGIDPPKQHDVGGLLLEFRDLLPDGVRAQAETLAGTSKWLRKERELAFYGDVDFVPTAEYTRDDAERAIRESRAVVLAAGEVIPLPAPPRPAHEDSDPAEEAAREGEA